MRLRLTCLVQPANGGHPVVALQLVVKAGQGGESLFCVVWSENNYEGGRRGTNRNVHGGSIV